MRFHFQIVICSTNAISIQNMYLWKFALLPSIHPNWWTHVSITAREYFTLSLNTTNMIIPSPPSSNIISNKWGREVKEGVSIFSSYSNSYKWFAEEEEEEVLISFTIHHTNVITNIVDQSVKCNETIETCF